MDEEFESLVVTDPDLVDEGIDISGLRTQTDVSPYLLGNIPDYAGIQYEAFNPSRLSDLMRLYSSGLPAIDTSTAAPPATGGGGSGDGGQATTPITTPTQPDSIAGFDPGVTPGPSGFIGLDPDMDIDPRDIDDYGTYTPPTTPVDNTINIEGTETFTAPTFEGDVTYQSPINQTTPDLKPIQDLPMAQEPLDIPTQDVGPLSQVQVDGGLSAIDEERLAGYTPSFDTSELTDATPEQRNTIQNILTAAGDNVQGALTELGKIPGAVVDFANQTVDFFGKKLNVGKTLASIALNKIAGGPVSLLFDILPQDSLENRTTRSIVDELKAEKNYGFNVQTGTLNQDPFGRNPVSQFGNYEQTLTEDINNPSDTRMGKAKKEFAQDYFDKKAEKAGGAEVDEGVVLGPGEAPGDLVSLEDLQAERDAEIAAQNELTKLTGDVDTFDTTPADTTNIVDEVALTGGGGRDRDPDPAPSAPKSDPKPTPDFYQDPITTGGGGNQGDPGGKSIVCTAMYQTTGLEDWSKAMKIWYIYQKKYLTIQHQEGYHKLFKPFVKGMHKSSIIKAIGAHVARHRTQHLKHVMFNSKPSLLGKIYNKILEPICYWVGRHG